MKRILLFISLMSLVAIVASACSFSDFIFTRTFHVNTANIIQAVLAEDVKGDAFEPVDPTSTFPTNQAIIHLVVTVANAPSETKVKTVWTAVDVGDAAPANTKIDEAEVTMDSSGNAHFTLSLPTSGAWPVGQYKVDVYLNDKLDRTLEYTVAE